MGYALSYFFFIVLGVTFLCHNFSSPVEILLIGGQLPK